MSITTNSAGVACCGHCGSELRIVCTGGCAEPDITIPANRIAALPVPHRTVNPERVAIGICNVGKCYEPVAPKQEGRPGRSPAKCVKHLKLAREADARAKARKAAA